MRETFEADTPATHREQADDTRVKARRGNRIVVGCVLALVALTALCAFQIIQARQDLNDASVDMSNAEQLLKTPAQLNQPAVRATAYQDLQQAQSRLHTASDNLSRWYPITGRFAWVPTYGPEIGGATVEANAGYHAAGSAVDIVRGLELMLPVLSHRSGKPTTMPTVTRALQRGHADYVSAHREAVLALSALRGNTISTGNAQLQSASVALHHYVPPLESGAYWLSKEPALMGWKAPARYLVVWENGPELRATGGFIAAADLITATRGRITKKFSSSALPHEIRYPRLPLGEAAVTSETNWLFRDSNYSPDFPTSARLERWFYGEDTGVWVNGVIDLVDVGLTTLLQATGPVYLPQYGVSITASNAQRLTNKYTTFASGVYHGPVSGNTDTIRKQFLGFAISAIIQRVQTLPFTAWPRVGAAIGSAIRHKDVMIYATNRQIQSRLLAEGAGNPLRPVPGDFVYVVDDNRSYSKVNTYVHESAGYRAVLSPDKRVKSTLTLYYRVGHSPASLEGFGPDYGLYGTKHDYLDFLRVYVPAGATVKSSRGVHFVAPGAAHGAYGMTEISGYFLVRAGHRATIQFQYTLPANMFQRVPVNRYDATVFSQPGGNLHTVGVRLVTTGGVTVQSASGSTTTYHRILPIGTNARVSVPLGGPLNPKPSSFPNPPSYDPYIPWPVSAQLGPR